MLSEIRVKDLGVIEDLALTLGPGMTALTGETGAGKTLVVEALELLMGGRADAQLVRAGASLARVEGRFVGLPTSAEAPSGEDALDGSPRELILARELPADGRSKAYVDGRMATAQVLSEVGSALVDLHGQHAHQSLIHQSAQRRSLDHFAGIDDSEVTLAGARLAELTGRLAELGGDTRGLARELDLLRFQLAELEEAGLEDPDEEERLSEEADVLSRVEELRSGLEAARRSLSGADSELDRPAGASTLVAEASSCLGRHEPLRELAGRLAALGAEIDDIARELRRRAEDLEDDPTRLAQVQERRHLLSGLRRKYGDSIAAVIAFREQVRRRLYDIEQGEARRSVIEVERDDAKKELSEAEERLAARRREAAPRLSAAIGRHLKELAMERARLEVEVAGVRGEQVTFLLGANPGEPALPLARVASGGELARAMLATRLVLSEAPPTLVFDEVDAGVGGEAARAVGRALSEIAGDHQVLVVTHLAQVAAFADAQVAVRKEVRGGRTVATACPVTGEERVRELSRMLSGHPDSAAARQHASELLETARRSASDP